MVFKIKPPLRRNFLSFLKFDFLFCWEYEIEIQKKKPQFWALKFDESKSYSHHQTPKKRQTAQPCHLWKPSFGQSIGSAFYKEPKLGQTAGTSDSEILFQFLSLNFSSAKEIFLFLRFFRLTRKMVKGNPKKNCNFRMFFISFHQKNIILWDIHTKDTATTIV